MTDDTERLAVLKKRIRNLAHEKSHLQLIAELLTTLAPLTGLREVVETSLSLIMNCIGGTNVSMVFQMDGCWEYLDVYGTARHFSNVNDLEDEMVRDALDSRQVQRRREMDGDTGRLTLSIGRSAVESWVFPLCVDDQALGALKTAGILIHYNEDLVKQLRLISNYIAMVIAVHSFNESRLKSAFTKLQEQNIALEREITDRKMAVAENQKLMRQLQQVQKMEAIGTLAGGIAHDFNNILGAVIGYADLALEENTNPVVADFLSQILTAGDRARDLVNQILAFSRKQEIEIAPIEPAEVVKEVSRLLRASLPSTVSMEIFLEGGRGWVLGNQTQLHQIMMNLCTNANHAMAETGGKLTIRVERRVAGEGSDALPIIRISVGNTGPPIPEHILPRIFEPYFTTKAVGKGTGMGLAVVHGIVLSWGGDITVESTAEKGTVFHCELPLVEPEHTLADTKRSFVDSFSGHLLVVDDEPMIATMATGMLRRLGFSVASFTDSREALSAFLAAPEQFTAVITDQTMPYITGLELSKSIVERSPGTPVVLFTGYSNIVDSKCLVEFGVAALGKKPYRLSELAEILRGVLR